MLKPAQGIAVIAHLCDRPLSWTEQTCRLMREADIGLWPQVGRGRRDGAVSVAHMVNLLLAAADPAGEAVRAIQTAAEYRKLTKMSWSLSLDTAEPRSVSLNEFAHMVHEAERLGSFLEQLVGRVVTDLRDGAPDHPFASFLQDGKFEIVLQRQAALPPIITIRLRGVRLVEFRDHRFQLAKGPDGVWWYETPQRTRQQVAILPCDVLVSLAAALAYGRPDFATLPHDALMTAVRLATPSASSPATSTA